MISNKEIKMHLDSLDRRMDLMDRSLLLHNPDGQRAAEMFDRLRQKVAESLSATKALRTGLAQLDQIAESTDDIEFMRVKLTELMQAASMRKVVDGDGFRAGFDVLGTGSVATVTRPAYIADTGEGLSVVVRGVVELTEPIASAVRVEEPAASAAEDDEESPVASDAPGDDKDSSNDIGSRVGGTE